MSNQKVIDNGDYNISFKGADKRIDYSDMLYHRQQRVWDVWIVKLCHRDAQWIDCDVCNMDYIYGIDRLRYAFVCTKV